MASLHQQHGSDPIKPSIHAVLLADAVFRDGRGKYYIVGPFDRVFVDKFPGRIPAAVYARIGDFAGAHKVTFTIVDGQDKEIMRVEASAENKGDTPITVEVGTPIFQVMLPAAGTYYLRTLIDGELDHYDLKIQAVGIERGPK